MTFVVNENCIKCKYTDCVEVCPVDCFHEGPNMLVIDPEECIDCTLCEPECPVDAILSEAVSGTISNISLGIPGKALPESGEVWRSAVTDYEQT